MTGQNEFEAGSFVAKGPVSNVSVHNHMRSGPNAIIGNPIDLAVVVELMFLLAERARTSPANEVQRVTPQSVLQRLRELGVQSGNGSRLIGRDAVYESFARLRAKGYIRRVQLRADNKAASVTYEFYEFPAWNPEPPPLQVETASSQVGAASGIAGSGNAGSRKPEQTKSQSPQVGATSGNAGSPPHPPEEVTTSSPNPLTDTGGNNRASSKTEGEEAGYAEEDLKAAADVLQLLPDPWTQGKLNAGRLAPKLLAVMAEQGWPGIHLVDRAVLTGQLTKNPHKVTNPYRLLASDRVPNLPRYDVVAAAQAARGGAPDEMCPEHPQYRAGLRCIPCRMA